MKTRSTSTRVPSQTALAVPLIVLVCMALIGPTPAHASGVNPTTSDTLCMDSASNVLPNFDIVIDAVFERLSSLPMMNDNNIRLGRKMELSDTDVKDDLVAIGQQSNVKKTKAKGNLLIAGWDVAIDNSSSDQSILALGQNTTINNTNAQAIAAVGNTVSVNGTCENLAIYADTAHIDGVVNGIAAIGADNVEIGSKAQIKGTLYISGSHEPVIQKGAKIANMEFVKSEETPQSTADAQSSASSELESAFANLQSSQLANSVKRINSLQFLADAGVIEPQAEGEGEGEGADGTLVEIALTLIVFIAVMGIVAAVLSEFASVFFIYMAVLGFFGAILTAVLSEWLFRRQTSDAARMITKRTFPTIGSGVIGTLVIPLLVLLFVCLGVTLPLAGAITFGSLAMSSIATGFMGASVFRLAFKKLGRFKCALAGGAIMGLASAIPYLGSVVSIAAFMYLLGYILQSIYLSMQDSSPALDAAATVQEAAAEQAKSEQDTATQTEDSKQQDDQSQDIQETTAKDDETQAE